MRISLPKFWPLLAAAALFLAGCATPFTPARYTVDPDRQHALHTSKVILLCPAFDHTTQDAPGDGGARPFSPAAYLTGILEQELTASGASFRRLEGNYSPSFEGVSQALADGSLKADGGVVLTAAVNAFPSDFVLSCDFKLYSAAGKLLFEKRGLCMNFSLANPALLEQNKTERMFDFRGMAATPKEVEANKLRAPRMVMQQLFGDRDFQKAIQ